MTGRGEGGGPQPIRRSPTGRIPKWVMDEAAGRRPVDAVPFRAAADTVVPPGGQRTRARRRWHAATAVKAVAAAAGFAGLVAAAWYLGLGPRTPTTAAAGPAAGHAVAPPAGLEESPARLAPQAAGPASAGGYRFSAMQADKASPVTWSPCRPIHYVIRPDNAPLGGEAMIAESFARLSQATGLVFVDDGPTGEAPADGRGAYQPEAYGDRWAPVLIAWATPDEVPDFGVDIAGEAGAARITTPSGDDAYVTGTVYLDPAKIDRMRQDLGAPVARSVVMHELGHLVGLAHVNDDTQVMWPRGNGKLLVEYQAGDLAGLAALGAGACQPDI